MNILSPHPLCALTYSRENEKIMRRNKRNFTNISLLISFLSLIVSILTLTLTFIIWRSNQQPSIKATCESKILDNSFELIKDGDWHFGRIAIDMNIILENDSDQGYIVECQPTIKRTLANKTTTELRSSSKLFYKNEINPFESLTSKPMIVAQSILSYMFI